MIFDFQFLNFKTYFTHSESGLVQASRASRERFFGLAVLPNFHTDMNVNSRCRFLNLSISHHNYLRITRMLKALGHFGFEHYKVRFDWS